MILNCAIVDDEPLALELLKSYVEKTSFLRLVGRYSSAVQAMTEIPLHEEVHVLFLDIQMPELNGLEFSRMVSPETRIIFTTAFGQYALDSYKVNALDYLLKPISYVDFLQSVNKAVQWYELKQKADNGVDADEADDCIYVKGKGIVLREPSVVAVNSQTGDVLAVGAEARRMLGRTPGNIVATRPLKDGVISNYTVTEKMLKHFITRACGKSIFSPRIMICIPSQVTEVEKKAVIDAATTAGARRVYLIEEPIAAAIGAGIDISKACGNMVVDIGGGTADIAVISLGGSVVSTSIKVAGDKFDEAIVKYIKRKHNMMIGERTAEDLKVNIRVCIPKNSRYENGS